MLLNKDVEYFNYYTKKQETITLTWNIEDGFENEVDALVAVNESGQDIEEFSIVKFKGMYYPVSICTTAEEIVISKEYIWYKMGTYEGIEKFERNNNMTPPYIIKDSRVSRLWTGTIGDDMKEFDNEMICTVAKKVHEKSYMERNCIIVFGCAMFDTMIPVFKLNCMDSYFELSPSRMKLWQEGIKAYNPFNGKRKQKNSGKPYAYQQYCHDTHIEYVDYDEKKKRKEQEKAIKKAQPPKKPKICRFVTIEYTHYKMENHELIATGTDTINGFQVGRKLYKLGGGSHYLHSKGTKIVKKYDEVPDWADNNLLSIYKNKRQR